MIQSGKNGQSEKEKELIGQSTVDKNYYDAVQQGKIALLVSLAKYLGRRLEPPNLGRRYLWKSPDEKLVVYLNQENDYMIVNYDQDTVCSTIKDKQFFTNGPWWNIIKGCRKQIEIAKRQTIADKLKDNH